MTEEEIRLKIAENIRIARKSSGLGYGKVAKKIGTSSHQIYQWEKGRSVPRISFLPKLAKALNVTPADIWNI